MLQNFNQYFHQFNGVLRNPLYLKAQMHVQKFPSDLAEFYPKHIEKEDKNFSIPS
jgi:hypothetical protein